jgi:hypothetical protein
MRYILVVLTALAIAVLMTAASDATPECMTYKEARAQWKTSWLYWHGKNHCWDNVGRKRGAKRDRIKTAPAPQVYATAGEQLQPKEVKTVMVMPPPKRTIFLTGVSTDHWFMLDPIPMPEWPIDKYVYELSKRPRFTPWEVRIASAL